LTHPEKDLLGSKRWVVLFAGVRVENNMPSKKKVPVFPTGGKRGWHTEKKKVKMKQVEGNKALTTLRVVDTLQKMVQKKKAPVLERTLKKMAAGSQNVQKKNQ